MGHPENAYAFNERSISCCGVAASCEALVDLLDLSRAWRLHEAGPLIKRLKLDPGFEELKRTGKQRDKILKLLDANVNRPRIFRSASERLLFEGTLTRGLTVAYTLGGFLLSWPCGCDRWSAALIEAEEEKSGETKICRHVGSADNLDEHWTRAVNAADKPLRRPRSVRRVDNARNPSAGEVPHIHFSDGAALNIDGAWKHKGRPLSAAERAWLARVGWVLPDAA